MRGMAKSVVFLSFRPGEDSSVIEKLRQNAMHPHDRKRCEMPSKMPDCLRCHFGILPGAGARLEELGIHFATHRAIACQSRFTGITKRQRPPLLAAHISPMARFSRESALSAM